MNYPYRKRFTGLSIDTAETSVSKEFELDKTVTHITGIYLTSKSDKLLFNRGEIKVTINGREYIPEEWETKVILTGSQTDPNKRFVLLDPVNTKVVPLDKKIKVVYKDTDHPDYPFSAYSVSFYVEGEQAE